MCPYVPIWVNMGSYGPVWAHMGLYGPTGRIIKQYIGPIGPEGLLIWPEGLLSNFEYKTGLSVRIVDSYAFHLASLEGQAVSNREFL